MTPSRKRIIDKPITINVRDQSRYGTTINFNLLQGHSCDNSCDNNYVMQIILQDGIIKNKSRASTQWKYAVLRV